MDPDKLDPNALERSAFIGIQTLKTMGLDTDSITDIEHDIERASGTFSTEEEDIVNAIEELETYSDIVDLNKRFRNNLQYQINSQITDGLTPGGSDTKERRKIVKHLNKAARRSGKADVAAIVGDKITITLTQ